MDFNFEATREELESFEKDVNDVSPLLENYLQVIAKTGNALFPWNKLQPLLKRKIELVLAEFSKSCPPESIPSLPNTETFDYEIMKTNLLSAVDRFPNAPFTIQRLCELVVNPKKHYSRTDKYMRGLEKNLLVVSTIESIANELNARGQIPIMNGNDSGSADGSFDELNDRNQNTISPNPSSNGTVLENFATVFPTANRITPPPPSNIQVPAIVMQDNSNFLNTECIDDFNYAIGDNVSVTSNGNLNNEIMSDPMVDDETALTSDNIENSEELSDNSILMADNSNQPNSSSEMSHISVVEDIQSTADEDIQSAVDEDVQSTVDENQNIERENQSTSDDGLQNCTDDNALQNCNDDNALQNCANEATLPSSTSQDNEDVGLLQLKSSTANEIEMINNEEDHDKMDSSESNSDSILSAVIHDDNSNASDDKMSTNSQMSENEMSLSPSNSCEEPLPKRIKLDILENTNEQAFESENQDNSELELEKEVIDSEEAQEISAKDEEKDVLENITNSQTENDSDIERKEMILVDVANEVDNSKGDGTENTDLKDDCKVINSEVKCNEMTVTNNHCDDN